MNDQQQQINKIREALDMLVIALLDNDTISYSEFERLDQIIRESELV